MRICQPPKHDHSVGLEQLVMALRSQQLRGCCTKPACHSLDSVPREQEFKIVVVEGICPYEHGKFGGYGASPAILAQSKCRIFHSGLGIADATTTDDGRQSVIDCDAFTVTSPPPNPNYIEQHKRDQRTRQHSPYSTAYIMSFDIPTVAEIQLAAESGQRITQDDVSAISQAESALTGRGPARGGPAGEGQLSFLQAEQD